MEKIIVGSEEWCAFPSLAIPAIRARVDSGAKTSSLHAFNISTFRRNTEQWVTFEVHPLQNNCQTVVRCEAPVIDSEASKAPMALLKNAMLFALNYIWVVRP